MHGVPRVSSWWPELVNVVRQSRPGERLTPYVPRASPRRSSTNCRGADCRSRAVPKRLDCAGRGALSCHQEATGPARITRETHVTTSSPGCGTTREPWASAMARSLIARAPSPPGVGYFEYVQASYSPVRSDGAERMPRCSGPRPEFLVLRSRRPRRRSHYAAAPGSLLANGAGRGLEPRCSMAGRPP